MKKFISANWYKLMIGSSLLMASFGFMVYSVTPAIANGKEPIFKNANYKMIPVNDDGTISVKLSDEQLNRLMPQEKMDVNIQSIGGVRAAWIETYDGTASLCVCPPNDGSVWGWKRKR